MSIRATMLVIALWELKTFLVLELSVSLFLFLHEDSSCPPFSGRLLTDKLRTFGKMLSSSRAHLQL